MDSPLSVFPLLAFDSPRHSRSDSNPSFAVSEQIEQIVEVTLPCVNLPDVAWLHPSLRCGLISRAGSSLP